MVATKRQILSIRFKRHLLYAFAVVHCISAGTLKQQISNKNNYQNYKPRNCLLVYGNSGLRFSFIAARIVFGKIDRHNATYILQPERLPNYEIDTPHLQNQLPEEKPTL